MQATKKQSALTKITSIKTNLNPTFDDVDVSCSIFATFQIVNSTPANGLSFDVFSSVPSYLLIVNVPFWVVSIVGKLGLAAPSAQAGVEFTIWKVANIEQDT